MSGTVLTWTLSHIIFTTTQDFGITRGKEAQQYPRLLHFVVKPITKLKSDSGAYVLNSISK